MCNKDTARDYGICSKLIFAHFSLNSSHFSGKYFSNSGDKIVVITLEGDENLTNKMTKEGMLEDSTKVFPLIFENSEASEVVLSWRYPLVDKYGNKSEEIVYKIDLTKDTNDKINWDNFDFNNFKNVADQYWEHPALSNK